MQAIVLVGGEGTRLRPLTESVPKPALTLVDRPFLAYMVEWLAGHGVEEVVLACGFLPDVLREALGDGERSGARIRYVAEPEPLGTAGAIRFAADELGDELDERFLALNGDVLTDLDLTALLAAHEGRGARATLGLHPVEDAAAYGLVRRDEDGEVLDFLEKTGEHEPGEINAGHVRARALGARPDPGRRGRSRSSATSSRGWSATGSTAPPRRLLDGHRHPGALPAGDLGHPRGRGRDAGRADRPRAARRPAPPRSPRAPPSARGR